MCASLITILTHLANASTVKVVLWASVQYRAEILNKDRFKPISLHFFSAWASLRKIKTKMFLSILIYVFLVQRAFN